MKFLFLLSWRSFCIFLSGGLDNLCWSLKFFIYIYIFHSWIYPFSWILQATIMKSYPPKLLFVTLQCFLSTIQSFAIAIAFERDPYQWKLGWNVRLVAVAYCVTLFFFSPYFTFHIYIFPYADKLMSLISYLI